ncbi:S8 family peptidase [Nocardioides dilutus]
MSAPGDSPTPRPSFSARLLASLRATWHRILGRPSKGQEPQDDLKRRTAEVQLGLIREALGQDGIGAHWGDAAEDGFFLYRPGHLLVRDDGRGSLEEFFAERQEDYDGEPRIAEELPLGLSLIELPRRRDGKDDLPRTLDEIERSGRDGIATPDHLLYVTPNGWGRLCPATEPELPLGKGPLPAVTTNPDAGSDIRVSVVDTGWYDAAAINPETPWLAGSIEGDLEHVDPHDIHAYAGHGTFVAGIIRCLAPKTYIEIEGVLTHAGAVFESAITRELNEAMSDEDRPQLISISAGTYTRNNRGLLVFEALAAAHGLTEREGGVLVVAAAGNDSSKRPFWPAAYPWVLSVGALDEDMCVSDFSNFGDWVDVYAHGRDLVNAFPTGTYTCHEPLHAGEVRSFTGMAQWSGTSFATPVVTGLIAAYMSEHGVSARQARDDLVAAGKIVTDPAGLKRPVVGPPFV